MTSATLSSGDRIVHGEEDYNSAAQALWEISTADRIQNLIMIALGGFFDPSDNPSIGSAPVEVVLNTVSYFLSARLGVARQQAVGAQNHTGRAEPTLESIVFFLRFK